MIFSNNSSSNSKCLFCISSLFVLFAVLLFPSSEYSSVDATRIRFRPKDLQPAIINQTELWKQKLKRHAINRARKLAKLDKLPPIPEVKVKRVIRNAKGEYNPCSVVDNLCLNGGTCYSDNEEWSCSCPTTHYGKSCEFLADQSQCGNNLCRNNATCYSIKEPRTVPNIKLHTNDVEKCTNSKEAQSATDDCGFTLTINYRCWCTPGFEGDFCEFSEAERCCAEDHCNHHGLITDLFNVTKSESCDADEHCKCICEEHYFGDNCENISPCRDRECLNRGRCEYNPNSDEAQCVCPSPLQFFHNGVQISGDFCEVIDFDEKMACNPCMEGKNFDDYNNCWKNAFKPITDKFAKLCGKETCTDLLKREKKFCMNGGECQVTVANFSDLSPKKPLFLIPKCQCDSDKFEGDFCEHLLLDECDKKDLSLNVDVGKNKTDRMKIIGTEEFLRELKNTVFDPAQTKTQSANARAVMSKAFERVLKTRGMLTFCGPNGFCRPYNEGAGFSCKCDAGYTGVRCETKDPCWASSCPAHSLCVAIPAIDEEASPEEQNTLRQTCICKTNQEIKANKCFDKKRGPYKVCFDEKNKQPKCANDGHCYPCELDNQLLEKAHVKVSRMPLCDAMERTRGFRCVCPPGYESASNCRNESQPCDFHHCQNGAKCIPMPEPDNALNYACKCMPGYGGSLCHLVEDVCLAGSSCGNGTCKLDSTLKRGFRCECVQGYHGFDCEQIGTTGFTAFFNENYRWTYPLLVFSLLTPVILVSMILQDRRTAAKYGSHNDRSYYQVLSNYVN